MWQRIVGYLSPEASVLDYGCGSGRYLLKLRGLVARAVGFDVSVAGLSMVRAHPGAQGWAELSVLGPDVAALEAHLARMARAVKPKSGRLLISVSNRARRFRVEQRPGQGDLVQYTRLIEGEAVPLSYQLFDAARLEKELTAAGFQVRAIGCESVLPEAWLLRHGWVRWLDGWLTPMCSVRWGYGIYAEASV